ncbi:MAG: hypothetical protein PUB00_01845, partial [Clostridiales bacterium]|nr:hypothetical protein [Clostridiales bacterium]
DKVDNALEGQTQSLRQSLVLRFSPDTPFSTKTSSANGFAVAHRCFSFQCSHIVLLCKTAAHVRLRDKF